MNRQKYEKICLTNREIEVAKLILKGLSNFAISNELSITLSTTKAHVSSIIRKLNVKNRTQAVLELIKNGVCKI